MKINDIKDRIKRRVRYNIKQNIGDKKRLSVFISCRNIYAQIIDDSASHTITSASSLAMKLNKTPNIEVAKIIGHEIGKKALAHNVTHVVFDRGNKKYHGKIQALADSARSAGLQF